MLRTQREPIHRSTMLFRASCLKPGDPIVLLVALCWSLVGCTADQDAGLEVSVEAEAVDDFGSAGTVSGDRGQLRAASRLILSAPHSQPLEIRPRSETDMDLLPLVVHAHSLGPDRAVVSGGVGFGGGLEAYIAYLVGREQGRLVLLDELRCDGSPFLIPWDFITTSEGPELQIAPCLGADCSHDLPLVVHTERWTLDHEAWLSRHLGSPADRRIGVARDRFELAGSH